ncbi:hypothetical protein COO60DRAFT_1521173, partial [Scenedesmus sp. NREL 46B-D3]
MLAADDRSPCLNRAGISILGLGAAGVIKLMSGLTCMLILGAAADCMVWAWDIPVLLSMLPSTCTGSARPLFCVVVMVRGRFNASIYLIYVYILYQATEKRHPLMVGGWWVPQLSQRGRSTFFIIRSETFSLPPLA